MPKSKRDYHKSRKFMIVIFIFFFAYSIIIFDLRGKQRIRNLAIVEHMHDNKKAFDLVNDRSRTEDTALVVFANLLLISMFIVADKRHLFE